MGNNNVPNQIFNVTAQVEKPCPVVPPVIVSYIYGSPIGWNAVVCGIISIKFNFFFFFQSLLVYYLVYFFWFFS